MRNSKRKSRGAIMVLNMAACLIITLLAIGIYDHVREPQVERVIEP